MNLLTVIIVAIAAFLAVTLILVALLLFAKAKLTTSGDVTININDGQKMLTVAGGSSLLNTLTSQGIFLPSACGGKGACGQCKCQVLEGGGDILPTETGFFNRKQIQDHWRLGCQVKVKENMKIAVPASVLSIKKWECEVVSNHNVATFIKEFVVKLPEGEDLNFRSGGYIQIDVPPVTVDFKNIDVDPEYREDWEKMHIFDLKMVNTEPQVRAYSCATYPAEGNVIKLNVRIATPPFDRATGRFMNVNPGVCSSYIYSLKPGDKITISGPYGEFFVKDTPNEKMFIGGGAGMAPMRSHIFDLFKTKHTKVPVTFWYGARSRRPLCSGRLARRSGRETGGHLPATGISAGEPAGNRADAFLPKPDIQGNRRDQEHEYQYGARANALRHPEHVAHSQRAAPASLSEPRAGRQILRVDIY